MKELYYIKKQGWEYEIGFPFEAGCVEFAEANNKLFIATSRLFFFRESKISCIRVRRMKIKGNGTDVFCVTSSQANVSDCVFVDSIDSHIKADIIRSSVLDILHYCIVGVAANYIMSFFVSVKAEQNQVGFGQVDRECTVRHNIDNQKTHLLSFNNQITNCFLAVLPQERFTATEEKDSYTHIVKLLHFGANLFIWMYNSGEVVYGTMFAF